MKTSIPVETLRVDYQLDQAMVDILLDFEKKIGFPAYPDLDFARFDLVQRMLHYDITEICNACLDSDGAFGWQFDCLYVAMNYQLPEWVGEYQRTHNNDETTRYFKQALDYYHNYLNEYGLLMYYILYRLFRSVYGIRPYCKEKKIHKVSNVECYDLIHQHVHLMIAVADGTLVHERRRVIDFQSISGYGAFSCQGLTLTNFKNQLEIFIKNLEKIRFTKLEEVWNFLGALAELFHAYRFIDDKIFAAMQREKDLPEWALLYHPNRGVKRQLRKSVREEYILQYRGFSYLEMAVKSRMQTETLQYFSENYPPAKKEENDPENPFLD